MSKSKADKSPIAINEKTVDAVISSLAKHPYLWTLIACLLLHPFYLGADENVPANALLIETTLFLAAGFFIIYNLFRSQKISLAAAYISSAVFFCINFFLTVKFSASNNKGSWLFIGGCLIILALYYFSNTKRFKAQLFSLMIMAVSFMLKFYYVYSTSVYTRQNDVHTFYGGNGHAGYIEYLINNKHLPDFDVRDVWSFSHPPLHHIICSIWIYVNEKILGIGYDPARESLQTLTLFYSMAIIITAYKILRYFRLEGAALYAPLLIISFHPSFILLSGSINNDVLSIALMMGAVLCTLRWYSAPTLKEIMKISLCIGLAMMSKLAAAVVAPPIALVFLIVFIKKFRTDGARLFGQFAAFGAVCAPLGLWYEIRNYIKWKVPITYVQEMDETVFQYIGSKSFKDRITDFSPMQFKSVFEQWSYIDENGNLGGYNEYNPLIALLKNSLFGEAVNENNFVQPIMIKVCTVFFYFSAILAAVCLAALIICLFVKTKGYGMQKTFLAVFYFELMVYFYKMAYDYPFTCTMNFRYITPTVIICTLFFGLLIKQIGEKISYKAEKTIGAVYLAASVIFVMLSIMVYYTICTPYTPPQA